MNTVPNQKTIKINRAPLNGNFLGINNDNWKNAARLLKAQAFLLYIYLASNKDQYYLALSPAAIQSEIGMPRSTFYDQLKKLESLGFLVRVGKNTYHFYEVPKQYSFENARAADNSVLDNCTAADKGGAENGHTCTEENIEINNKYNKYDLDYIGKPIEEGEKEGNSITEFIF